MKDPAMLFYTSDFLTGVQLMSMKERGQYITLLCLQQQRGHMTLKEMKKAVGALSDELLSKFVEDEEGRLYNKRAELEINKRKRKAEQQSANVSKRWNKNGNQDGMDSGNTMVLPFIYENANRKEEIERDRGLGGKRETTTRQNTKREPKVFTPPTFEEVAAYCEERQSPVDPRKFFDYFTTGDWKDRDGKQVKNWKQKLITWEMNEGGKKPAQKQANPKFPVAEYTATNDDIEEMKRLIAEMEGQND